MGYCTGAIESVGFLTVRFIGGHIWLNIFFCIARQNEEEVRNHFILSPMPLIAVC